MFPLKEIIDVSTSATSGGPLTSGKSVSTTEGISKVIEPLVDEVVVDVEDPLISGERPMADDEEEVEVVEEVESVTGLEEDEAVADMVVVVVKGEVVEVVVVAPEVEVEPAGAGIESMRVDLRASLRLSYSSNTSPSPHAPPIRMCTTP